ncbi:hypothetical protein CKAH01_01170 [Colletotrichum kahawae]|uniref:Uncharacterized protein n=1 Tax=Colletotrichum kahawae TaxID=34407 RepID=A0AAE0D6U5_COLKA|nr:hypothetical protein CKAH01_01170 [Colletotrichum kahawae]
MDVLHWLAEVQSRLTWEENLREGTEGRDLTWTVDARELHRRRRDGSQAALSAPVLGTYRVHVWPSAPAGPKRRPKTSNGIIQGSQKPPKLPLRSLDKTAFSLTDDSPVCVRHSSPH